MKYWLRRNDSLLDWITWQVMRYIVRRKIRQRLRQLAAAGIIALVVAAGFAAARWGNES